MNYKGKTKIISYIAVLAIIFSMIPQYTAAATATIKTINLGDYVQMGTYDADGDGTAEPILWRCVAFEKISGYDDNGNPIIDSTDTKTAYEDGYLPLMLADTSICEKEFDAAGSVTTGSHGRGSDRTSYGSNYWGDSNIRDWLNSSADTVTYTCGNSPSYSSEKGFLTNFNDTEKSAIKTVTQKSLLAEADKDISGATGDKAHIYNTSISTAVQDYATAYSEQVTDTMFLLDVHQVKNVYDNDTSLGGDCYYKLFDGYYWLRSPYSSSLDYVRNVDSSGYVSYRGAYYGNRGVRPAFFLDTEKEFVSGEGTSADPYTLTEMSLFDGEGTEESPYLISTHEQLEAFRDSVNGGETYEGKYFKLTANIDMSDAYNEENGNEWAPIGPDYSYKDKSFNGVFDGDNNTISLYKKELFEVIYTSGVIKNLNVSGEVTEGSCCGICGYNYGTISGCSFSGTVNGEKAYVGGICYTNYGVIEDCVSSGSVNGTVNNGAGGISGLNYEGGTIRRCYSEGTVSGQTKYTNPVYVGGVCGWNQGAITDCYNTANVSAGDTYAYIGGVAGRNNTQFGAQISAAITNCYNCGTLSGGYKRGGVYGYEDGTSAMTSSYYLDSCDVTNPVQGTAKTKDEFKSQSTFDGWDFDSIWVMSAAHGRPILKEIPEPDPPHIHDMSVECRTEAAIEFTDWTNASAMPSAAGNYVLKTDVTLTSMWQLPIGTTNLCLNGHTITGVSPATINVGPNKILNICDCQNNGEALNSDTLCAYAFSGGTINLYGGVVKGTTGGLKMEGGILNIYGGTAEASESSAYGVQLESSGKLNMSGGVIKAAGTVGQGIFANGSSCEADISGGVIIGGETSIYASTSNTVSVTGGIFSSDVSAFAADGYVVRAVNSDDEGYKEEYSGYYIVEEEPPLFEGDGTEESPYLISTLEQLETFRDNVNGGETYEGNYFKLANDIDLGGTEENQWTPIGVYSTGDHKKFAGSFDGGGFTVSGLYINSSKDAALFEWLDTQGTIKNINVSGNVTGTSDNSYVCGICCTNLGTIESCSFTGSASSVGYLGGICASNFGTIRKCCNVAYISGTDTYIGGIAGSNSGTIENCYNTGAVKGSYRTGGICGNNTGGNAIVQNCYNVGQIPGAGSIGGICGNNNATVSTSYYLTTSASAGNGSGTASGATAKTADDLNTQSTFLGWDFESIWKMSADHKRPILRDVSEPLPPLFEGMGTEQSPYLIPDLKTFKAFRDSVNGGEGYEGKFIKLTADIDLDGSTQNLWAPIGTQSARFKGSFDGDNHTVSGMYVFSSDYYLGLFGRSETAIRNLTVEGTVVSNGSSALAGGICGYNGGIIENCHGNVSVTGVSYSGGIVGETRGNVKCCFNTAAVSGEKAGGIAGSSYIGVIDNCYNTGSVSGTEKTGGIIGNMTAGSLTNSYNYGDVTAAGTNVYAGGVAGEVTSVASSGTVTDCYYLTGTAESGVSSSSSNQTAEVKTADEFKVQTGFDGWDFDTVWTMSTAHGRPILRAIPEPDPPHTHTLVHKDAVAATCTETGTGEYWKCEGTNGCNKMFSDADGTSEITTIPTISAAGHTWGAWSITTEPTLTATGAAERICTKNSTHKEVKDIPSLTDTSVWTVGTKVEPTEDTDGSQEYTSEYGTVTVTIPALGHTHNWGAWSITTEPTLTATGAAERICTKNSTHKETKNIPSLTDTSVWTVGTKVEPTEDTDGSQEYTSEYGTVTVTIPATGKPDVPVFDIDGTVVDKDSNSVANVKLSLKKGNTTVTTGETKLETVSNANGEFKFTNIPSGIYNLVAEYENNDETITVTSIVTVADQNVNIAITLPDYMANSILKIKGNKTPDIIVGGLDKVASDNAHQSETVTITMTVESKEADSANAEQSAIKNVSISKNIDYLDIKITKTVDDAESNISETNNIITIVIPFDKTGKKNIKVYRYHGDSAAALSENASDSEYFTIGDGIITVYANKFSTYAIGYDTENADPTPTPTPTVKPHYSSGTSSSYTVTFNANNGTKNITVKASTNTVIKEPAAPTKEGYVFDGWYMDNKLTKKYDFSAKVTKSFTLYAKWTEEAVPTAEPSVTLKPTDTNEPSDISKVQHKAYIVGYENGTFMPDGNITRAETSVILARLTDGFDENGSYTTSFADVDNNVWYYRYIGFEESENIITGYEDGTFKPENSITRAEFANMIVHFAELNTENADTVFTDINGHWAQNQIAACYAAGYIKGYADNTFMPDNYITRAEAVAIINRVLGRDDIKDFENPFSDVIDSHWAYANIMEAAVTHDAD